MIMLQRTVRGSGRKRNVWLILLKDIEYFIILPWEGKLGEGVCCEMTDGGVGEELHDHADVLGGGVEHHRGQVHGRTDT